MVKKSISKKSKITSTLIGDDFLTVARRLRNTLDDAPDQFRHVVKGLGIGMRKAYSLVQIDRQFRKLSVSPQRLRRIGWTKLVILAPHVTKGNYAALLDIAESNTAHEIKRWLKSEPVHDEERCVLLYFSVEQYALIEKVLLAYGAVACGGGLTGKEEAFVSAFKKITADF